MPERKRQFELPGKMEHYLATLSSVYARRGDRRKQEIIVNAQPRVHEGLECWWDSSSEEHSGHALYLGVPEAVYPYEPGEREAIQNEIQADLNQVQNVPGEHIVQVFLEMLPQPDRDWRRESGVLVSLRPAVTPSAESRIWGESGYRVFLSHKAEAKKEVASLKEHLRPFGISAFVAHTDIHPTKEWQGEIETALASMDAFVALLTDEFHSSEWTDQEVGYALGRGVPLIAVKLGRDPYGFIGKFQALACDWDGAPLALAELLVRQQRMLDAFVEAVSRCRSFDEGNSLSQLLPFIDSLTTEQAHRLASAFNENSQLQGSYGFTGERSGTFGDGLAANLTRTTGREYQLKNTGKSWPKKWEIRLKKR